MKTLGPGFLAEFKKHKSLQAAVEESLGSSGKTSIPSKTLKKTPKNSPKISKKDKDDEAAAGPSSESASKKAKEDEDESGKNQPYNRAYLEMNYVLPQKNLKKTPKKPKKNPENPGNFGNCWELLGMLDFSRPQAYLEMNFKEAVVAAVKFAETTPMVLNGKRIRVSVAETPQVKKTVKKKVLNPKKAPTSTKKVPVTNSKSPKVLPGKKEKVKKVPGEKKVKKTPNAEGKAEDSQIPPEAGLEIPKNPQNPKIPPEQEETQNSKEFLEFSGSGELPASEESAEHDGK
ncbi:hypothetical protein HGM15179_020043, partial [Zosterops borbonicus]